jgi:hypothetical protein
MSDIYLPTLISEALLAFSGLFGGVSISFSGNHSGCTSTAGLWRASFLVESVWGPRWH